MGRAGRVTVRTGAMWIVLSVILVVVVFVVLVVYVQPRRLLRWISRSDPRILYYVDTREKVLALTIDDSPHALVTPAVLDILKKHGSHATFFMLGNQVAGNEALVTRVRAEGHEIGNHLMTRVPPIAFFPSQFERRLLRAERLLGLGSGRKLFRPGSAWHSRAMFRSLDRHGYRCVLGSVYPHDTKVPFARIIEAYILRRVFPGCIVILHEGNLRRMRTARILDYVLPRLRARGYRIVTVSELMAFAGERS
jgi:peptidoglycan/xylan/chitin deacetylase (PgdA/CDA1 family)